MPTLSYFSHDLLIAAWNAGGLKLALLTAAPAADGSSNLEPNPSYGYARQDVTLGAATRGTGGDVGTTTVRNTNPLVFGPVVTTDWATVTHAGLFNDNGDLLAYSPLPSTRTAKVGDSISFGAQSLQWRFR